MSVADEIERLDALRQKGALSDEEYQRAKAALLDPPKPAGERLSQAVNAMADNENLWAMFLHFSQFCGYLVPLAGLIVPIIGGIKANHGEVWSYPLSLRFFTVN